MRLLRARFLWAYPRWRGGNFADNLNERDAKGLSPLARGKRSVDQPTIYRVGPIPAGAGETCGSDCAGRQDRAYPRWRGGNSIRNA